MCEPNPADPYQVGTCEGSDTEDLPCNESPCCEWKFTDACIWGECDSATCVHRRYAVCECNPSQDYPVCEGDQPYEEESCGPCPY
jgi:hypothetical protein